MVRKYLVINPNFFNHTSFICKQFITESFITLIIVLKKNVRNYQITRKWSGVIVGYGGSESHKDPIIVYNPRNDTASDASMISHECMSSQELLDLQPAGTVYVTIPKDLVREIHVENSMSSRVWKNESYFDVFGNPLYGRGDIIIEIEQLEGMERVIKQILSNNIGLERVE